MNWLVQHAHVFVLIADLDSGGLWPLSECCSQPT